MAGNSFGNLFSITTFGESHGKGLGVVIDGCPAGVEISEEEVQRELDRRRPGQSAIVTPRGEDDRVVFYSGIFEGKTTGAPIMMLIENKDAKSGDYDHMKEVFRPSHADFTYQKKYGIRDHRGGGRSSARETVARVMAGAVARKFLVSKGIEFMAFTQQVGEIKTEKDYEDFSSEMVESNIVRCPDLPVAERMIELINEAKKDGDSLGGVIKCVIKGVMPGLGEPVFDKLHAELGKAMLSINAVKGFEIGSGFVAAAMKGSEHNDEFVADGAGLHTMTNHAGGVLGGISSGEDIVFRVAFKPVATILKDQKTVNIDEENVDFRAIGRHDPCVIPRAVPIVEAMAALVVMDYYLMKKAYE